jgi:hypothetical protein
MTGLSETVSGEDKIMALKKMVLNLMKQNGCQKSYATQNHSI